MMMLGLEYNEVTEVLDALWGKLTDEQKKTRIVDFIPYIEPNTNNIRLSEETTKKAWGYLQVLRKESFESFTKLEENPRVNKSIVKWL